MKEAPETDQEEKPQKKKRGRILLWLVMVFLSMLVLFQAVFLLYSDQIFGRVIKEVVYQGSNKVYTLSYDKVVFNVFRNEMAFENFQLKADSNLYHSLLDANSSNRLFEAECPNLSLKGPSIIKLYFDDVLEVNELIIEKPRVDVRLYGELRTGKSGLRNFHRILSNYIGFLRIDNFQLHDAEIDVRAINDDGFKKFEFRGLNVAVTDFKLNKFFAKDSLVSLGNLSLSLDTNEYQIDSVSTLGFSALNFDAKDSILMLYDFSIKQKGDVPINNTPALDFKSIEVFGLNPRVAYFNNNFEARLIRADSGKIDYNLVKKPDSIASWNKIQGLFDTVSVNRVSLANTSLDYHKMIGKRKPHVIVPIKRGDLHFLLIDSQSFFGNKVNLYSKNIDLAIDEFDIYSKDSSSRLTTESLVLSTLRREILLFNVSVASIKKTEKGSVEGSIGSIQMFGVDPMLVIQKNEIIGRAVLIDQPNLVLRSGKEKKSLGPSEMNTMVRKQFRKVNVSNIEVEGGNLEFQRYNGTKRGKMKGLKAYGNSFRTFIGAVPVKQEFLCDWFNAEMIESEFQLDDNLHEFRADNLKVFSQKGGTFADRMQVRLKANVSDSIAQINDIVRIADFYNVSIEGLDLEKLRTRSILDVHYLESRGNNRLEIELNSPFSKSGKVNSVRFSELDIDSCDISIATLNKGNSGFKSSKTKIQVCDFRWDKDYAPGKFELYSVKVDGQDIWASSDKLEHVFKSSRLKINSSYDLFQFNNVDFRPSNDRFSGKNAFWFNSNQLRMSGFNLPLFFRSREVEASNFYCLKPKLTFHTLQDTSEYLSEFLEKPISKVGNLFPSVSIEQVRVQQGKVNFISHEKDKEVTYKVEELNAFMSGFAIDSTTTLTDTNVLFARESEIVLKGFEQRASDTSMILTLGEVELLPHKKGLTISNFEVKNRKEVNKIDHFSVKGDFTKLHDFDFQKFLINKRISARKIEFGNTMLTLGATKRSGNSEKFFRELLPRSLTNQYESIYADSLVFSNAMLNLRSRTKKGDIRSEKIGGWNVLLRVFDVNRNYKSLDFLYARAISAELPYYTKRLSDSLNILRCKNVSIDVNRGHIYLDSTVLTPRYEKMLFGKTHGSQIDRIEVYNMNSRVVNFNFEKWLYSGNYEAKYVYINRTNISVFRDKSLRAERGQFKEMPQKILRKLPIKLKIDTAFINSWSIEYEEQLPGNDESGLIRFTDFDAKVTGITNYDSLISKGQINVEVNTKLMDKGEIQANLNIPLEHSNDSFSFSGKVDNMDMREINPLLENLARISITRGTADWMKFEGNADRYLATGEVELRYGNLHVAVLDSTGENNGFVQKAMTFLANNFIIRSGNRLFPKSGRIYYERDSEKSIFNYGAKALLSGIKESIGIKNKEGG